MIDWVIEELRYKATVFEETGVVNVFNGDVIKSDIAIPSSVKETLQRAVRNLENVPDIYKDYHPGSDGKVLDLVHPSLYPLIYGRSRVLSGRLIGLEDCIENCGNGDVIQIRPEEEAELVAHDNWNTNWNSNWSLYSRNFQWLPCEVDIAGEDGSAKYVKFHGNSFHANNVRITSYINNLHPQQDPEIYSTIENVLARAIPLWDMTLTPLGNCLYYPRIEYELKFDPDPDAIPLEEKMKMLPRAEGERDDDYYPRLEIWENEMRRAVQPEPGPFCPPAEAESLERFFEPGTHNLKPENQVDLKRDYSHRGLQVIVKLANIELTPEKPSYDGGTWHVEGQLNEHICATALYYYDSENITESRLAFRQQSSTHEADEASYPQDVHRWLTEIFGCKNNEPSVQEVGSVVCSEGRLITFPNILQHKVLPFRLADPTKKGHRKILALFLVDPNIRIISTANVPPQQRDWWRDEVEKQASTSGKTLAKLSPEIKDKIFVEVEGFPMSMDDAREVRLRLMEERSNRAEQDRDSFKQHGFNLCEH
jgi:hypothetical protein